MSETDSFPTFETTARQLAELTDQMIEREIILTDRDCRMIERGRKEAREALFWRFVVLGFAASAAGFLLAWGTM